MFLNLVWKKLSIINKEETVTLTKPFHNYVSVRD